MAEETVKSLFWSIPGITPRNKRGNNRRGLSREVEGEVLFSDSGYDTFVDITETPTPESMAIIEGKVCNVCKDLYLGMVWSIFAQNVDVMSKKKEITIRSGAAEYLSYVASVGDQPISVEL